MKITYATPWIDNDSGIEITAVEIERTRFPHDDVGMEAEFRLFSGDAIVVRSTKALPVTDPALLLQALTTLANNIQSACQRP
jgi:hypothetical protein